jgi:hypothetical protein
MVRQVRTAASARRLGAYVTNSTAQVTESIRGDVIPVARPTFIEFGVEDYRESNTRFLLQSQNWTGLVIDSRSDHVEFIRRDALFWRYDLTAISALLHCGNINEAFRDNGMTGDVGLLSIDVDGNDYWVWDAISVVNPRIVICEYNSIFGPDFSVVVPYDPWFERSRAHYSNLYYGASISALEQLGAKKGYTLVAGNREGKNAFFVRNDLASMVPPISSAEAYVRSNYRESRDKNGGLTFLDFDQRVKLIEGMPVYDLDREALVEFCGS